MTVADALNDMLVADLDLSRHVIASPQDAVEVTIERMSSAGYPCALVTDTGRLAGVFTQRDVLMKVVGEPDAATCPTGDLMTRDPRTVEATQSVADALAVMNDHHVRNVPVVGDDRSVLGNVSFYVLMEIIAGLVADHSLGTPTEVSAHHGLEFVDFTGLNTRPTVTVHVEDSLEAAVHQMKTRAIGSVFVVDHRENLVGVVTEFDLQARNAWREPDLAARSVADFMTHNPVALSARSAIADAIQEMAASGFSHVPLLGESGRPIGVASFRDIADYFETTVALLE
ncbi:MAG: CBS domain-containing protein [Acidimicrobiia bacterium]|nr:CBS domain-containing protein [Acidimicrobiia bacterium]